MKKTKGLEGLSYRGGGYLLYKDKAVPRLTSKEVVSKVRAHLGEKVIRICTTPHVGHRDTVLQYERLYNKDMKRSMKKLVKKFNK